MRRLKHTSFSQSGPPAEWERRFAAIVRDRAAVDPPASIDRFELPLPSSPLPASPPAPPPAPAASTASSPPPASSAPSPPPGGPAATPTAPTAADGRRPAGVPASGGEVGLTRAGGWAESWAAQIATGRAVPPEPIGLPPISFDGFASVAAGETAPKKMSALARLKRRLLKAGGRGTGAPRPRGAPRGAETGGPSLLHPAASASATARDAPGTARDAGPHRDNRDNKVPGAATPDFPRRPAARRAERRSVAPRDADLPAGGARPGAAAWLSRADGPLRTTAHLPVVGPALVATAIIVGCGLSAAYLTQRFGLEFDPVVRTVAGSFVPVQAPAVADAPVSAPSVLPPIAPSPVAPPPDVPPPVTLSSVTPSPVEPSPAAPPAPVPPPLPPAGAVRSPPVVDPVAMVGLPAVAPRPPVAGRGADGPVVAAAAAPREFPAPLRPTFTTPPAAAAEAVPLLPFPLQSASARGTETGIVAPGRLLGWSDESVAPLVAPLAPRSVFAAEAITARTVDAVPLNLHPSDARVDDGVPRRAVSLPPAADVPEAWAAVSPLVADIQRALRRHGFDPGPIDGIAGPRTVAAVRAFQRRVGERPDGVADTALLRDLKRTPATEYADGAPGPARGSDPLAGLIRALSDLFGLPAASGFDGSIASADDRQRVDGGSRRDGDARVGD